MRAGGDAASRAATWISAAAPGGVVIGAVVYQAGAVRVQAAEAAESQMVVVGAEDDGLIAQHRIAAGQDADHVLADQRAGVRLSGSGRFPAHRERLEPPAGGRLKPDLGKSAGQVGGSRIGAARAGHPALEPVVAQEPDVIEQAGRFGALGLERGQRGMRGPARCRAERYAT